MKWIATELTTPMPEPTPTCQCDDPAWELHVEEGQAVLMCSKCDEHHWTIDASEYLTLEPIPVTVKQHVDRNYSGEVDTYLEVALRDVGHHDPDRNHGRDR